MKPIVNKKKRINKLASDIKELLHLDKCKPVLETGRLWLRMKSGAASFDCPVGLKPLFDKKNDNIPAIKQAIILAWIAHLESQQAEVARGVLSG